MPIIGFTNASPDKTFYVNLSNPVNAAIAVGQGVGTIVAGNQAGSLEFSMPNFSGSAPQGPAQITVTRIDGTASGVSVQYATSGGTAVPNVDYTPVSGALNFGFDVTSQTFPVPLLDNPISTGNVTVGLTLSNPGGLAILGPQSTAVLTILEPNTLIVTNTNDSGPGSLRQAILTADAAGRARIRSRSTFQARDRT